MDMKVYKFYTLKTLYKATSSSETKANSKQSKWKNLFKNDDIDDEDDNLMNVNKSEFTSKTGRLDILSNKLLNL